MRGLLTDFRAVPPDVDANPGTVTPIDWDRVFELAGLDRRAFTPTSPLRTPLVPFDERMAWDGVYPEHVEIGAGLSGSD